MIGRAFEAALPPHLIRGGRRRVLATTLSAAIAAAFLATTSGEASEHPADAPQDVVRGVPLASICDACGVVSDVRAQERKAPHKHKGAIAGAVIGGLAGHGIGEGSGRDVATIVGGVGGAAAGDAIEKKAQKGSVWTTTVTFKDGSVGSYERKSDPGLLPGDVVTIEAGNPVRRPPQR